LGKILLAQRSNEALNEQQSKRRVYADRVLDRLVLTLL
jgi:hypothetical protein